ncbi:unnamed protein product [Sympodiomycopsis kandeliae]
MIRSYSSSSSTAASVSSLSAYMRSLTMSSSSSSKVARRSISTSSSNRTEAAAYPFSSRVNTHTPPPVASDPSPIPTSTSSKRFNGHPALSKVNSPKRGVIDYVHHQLRSQLDPGAKFTAMFHRNSSERIPIGSIISVETYTTPSKTGTSTFSGVLIAIRRRGTSTSFVLRNLISKLGVEVRYNLYSPLLKDIKVIAKADSPKRPRRGVLVRSKKAKLYYLRKNEARLASISRLIKAHKQNDQKAEAIRDEQAKKEAEETRRAAKKAAKDAKKSEQ